MECPICNERIDSLLLYDHLQDKHMYYLLTVASMMLPTYDDNAIFSMFGYEETNDYEDLSNLCEEMGNVYIGVSNIDEVAPATICDSQDKCPICFENLNSLQDNFIRKIKKCRHIFCNICITTWLEKHKTCPVCKIELTE